MARRSPPSGVAISRGKDKYYIHLLYRDLPFSKVEITKHAFLSLYLDHDVKYIKEEDELG
jgi:hypothetical protein